MKMSSSKELSSGDACEEVKPLISFGLISDIQYADHDDAFNHDKDKLRYYRNGLNVIKHAVNRWRGEVERGNNFKFIMQLGDLVDGKAKKYPEVARDLVLKELKADFESIVPGFGLYHIWGNHEFYCFKRKDLVNTELNSARALNPQVASKANYYTLDLTQRLKLICLDFYEVSLLGFDETEEFYSETLEMVRRTNKNADLNSPARLRGYARRFTKFNGSPSQEQMQWLENELKKCEENNVKAIVCGHVPVFPKVTVPMCLAWNFKEMLELFGKYKNTIVAYLCGHDHPGGYARDKNNIHHLVVVAVIETPRDTQAYATVNVYEDKIQIQGYGLVDSYEFPY